MSYVEVQTYNIHTLELSLTVVYTLDMKTVINIKADREVKEGAVKTAKMIGLPLSTVINAFLKKFIADQSVTFDAPAQPSRNLQKLIRQAENDIKKGRNLSPLFTNMEKMDRYLANL